MKPSEYSPLGMDCAPASFLAQNGPLGWTGDSSAGMIRTGYILLQPNASLRLTVDFRSFLVIA
jgi:hypothetical protein